MDRVDRRHLRAVLDEIDGWVRAAVRVRAARVSVVQAGDAAFASVTWGAVALRSSSQVAWRVVPLRRANETDLAALSRVMALPPITRSEQQSLDGLVDHVATQVRTARIGISAKRFFAGGRKREEAAESASFLMSYRERALASGLPQLLQRLESAPDLTQESIPLRDALDAAVGLDGRLTTWGSPRQLVAASELADLAGSVEIINRVVQRERLVRSEAMAAGEALRRRDVDDLLASMPVDRIREATRDRLRVGPLMDAGIRDVRALLNRRAGLETLPGVGPVTARRMIGAAETLRQIAQDETPVRIDVHNQTPEATRLLRTLADWNRSRGERLTREDVERGETLLPLARALGSDVEFLVLIAGSSSLAQLSSAVDAVVDRARDISPVSGTTLPADPWQDFQAKPADYQAMLAELGLVVEDDQKAHGDLPEEVIEAVRAFELNTTYLSASLRGYQSFGARFALVQGKVIIGDEMGLGKTVEALAVLAHLHAAGHRRFLVICPAAVVTNWVREVGAKSRLIAHRAHGPQRDRAMREWARTGGVAVTTFETLPWVQDQLPGLDEISCVIIDEAHYIKNPEALRSQRCASLIEASDRAILLTGTPLENRIQEFRALVDYVRPDLVVDADEWRPRRFRQQVAPAYLRRNQEDVLSELPELVEVDEWLPFSDEDLAQYREAVASGNFMAMRQAGMLTGEASAKMQRLIEIVGEAEESGRRVIVYSHFLKVLDRVAANLPGKVFGPLTGAVPAVARQVMVDEFSKAEHGAVLVSQIVAGGVGLNVQAASIVIICEPQLKPTTEWQAIARAHRMGQLQSVQVHRLVSEAGVDLRIREILDRKRQLFDDFARVSETAESAPEAFDITEAKLAREIVAAEQERLGLAG